MNQPKKKPTSVAKPLRSHNVFLDTQVYRSCYHDPKSPILGEMSKKIIAGEIKLHITDITLLEIERQIREMTREVSKEMKEPRIKYNAWRKRLPDIVKTDLPAFDHEAVAKGAIEKFNRHAKFVWKAKFHAATKVSAVDVFRSYFENKPPFEARDSKEFPDAFVIRALEQWCIDNNETMYVVGQDKAMGDAAETSPHLHRLGTLTEFLECASVTDTQELAVKATDLLDDPGILASLETAIENQVGDLIPIYAGDQLYEGEVTDHEYGGSIELVDFKVIAASPKEITLVIELKIALFVDVDYEDRTYASYDNEDGIYVGGEAATKRLEPTPKVRVFARIRTDKPGKPVLRDVEIITREFNFQDEYHWD